jgi:tRNA-dihydrouridine synthase A
LKHADGAMLGREAYYNPWLLSSWDATFFNDTYPLPSREAVEEAMVAYMERAFSEDGCPWYAIARQMLGLYHGQRGARLWRQVWSDHRLKPLVPREVWQLARQALERGADLPA